MKYNSDGTKYCLDTILEIIEQRSKKERWPSYSDLVGADFMMGRNHNGDPECYKKFAESAATHLYSN